MGPAPQGPDEAVAQAAGSRSPGSDLRAAFSTRIGRRIGDRRALALVDQAVVSGCNFLTTVILARTLPVEAFGIYSVAFLICLLLSNLHRAALTQPMNVLSVGESDVQEAARLHGLLRAHWLIAGLCAAVFVAAVPLALADFGLAAAAAFYFICFALQETARRYWYGRFEIGQALANDVLSYGAQVLLLGLLAWWVHVDARIAFVVMGATSLLAVGAAWRRLPRRPLEARLSLAALAATHWPLAKWLVLTVCVLWGAGQVYPLLMLPLGATAVATFVACKNLLNAVGLVVQSVGNYLPTSATAILRQRGPAALRREIVGVCGLFAVGTVLFLGLIGWFAEDLLHLIYGGRYDHAAGMLRVLAVGTAFAVIGAILGAYSLAMADARAGFLSNLGASGVTFTIGLWLIDRMGMDGAALGNVLSLLTAALLQAVFVGIRLRALMRA